MKKAVCAILLTVLLALSIGAAAGETLTFETFSADSEAEYLNLDLTQIPNRLWKSFLEYLEQFPNLKKVDMFDVIRMDYKRVEEIHARFPDVEFGMTMVIGTSRGCPHTIRTDCTAFSTLHSYYPKWHPSKELAVLRFCKNLYALDIGHNLLDDLSFLYEMPQLRVLIIAAGSAKDITPVGSLKHLEYLEVFANQVRDISCLEGLPYLIDLNITNNLIEDLTPLKSLKSLKRLWIYAHTRKDKKPVDEATLADLQAALPDCYIDGHSTSTDGGWRGDNAHYLLIRKMFRSNIYEPFEDSPPENIPEGFAPAGPAADAE